MEWVQRSEIIVWSGISKFQSQSVLGTTENEIDKMAVISCAEPRKAASQMPAKRYESPDSAETGV